MKYDNFGNPPFASTQNFNINLTKFGVCLETVYFVETNNLLLKVL